MLVLPAAACETGPPPAPDPAPPPTTPAAQARLTFAVQGARDELSAYRAMTETFNSLYDGAEVELRADTRRTELMADLRAGKPVPDVFMVSREDLAWLLEEGLTQPVDTLMDERGVDFGDGYSRDALQAFSADDRLQCMPYGISPRVMFYNTELVDFDRMEARGLLVPGDSERREPGIQRESWTFEQFTAAAEFASRPRKHTRGFHIEPTLRSLTPFIQSGGGQIFDDELAPTSLAFSDGATLGALEVALPVLRNPLVTLDQRALDRRSALEWFERGKLAMLPGHRALVPRLRQVQGLDFDVIAMPVLDSAATVGDITGLCLSADAADVPAAADLMVHVLSAPSVQRVAHAGYLVPANLEVALSDDFLQPGRQPASAQVFTNAVRAIVLPPLLTDWTELENVVAHELDRMLNQTVLDDLEALAQEIDEESRVVLAPESASPGE